jgi:glucokinase
MEIGGTHVTAALVDLAKGLVVPGSAHRRNLHPSGSAAELLGTIVACGSELPATAGQRWGVALPGPFDYDNGVGLFVGVGKFESLYGTDIRGPLMAGLPGPPGSVTFLNDADAFGWGEWAYGAAAGYERCVAVTLGTGIGSAFLAAGAVHQCGTGVPPEGRVDLLVIDGQPLEDVVSTRAIERAYRARHGASAQGTAEIAARARSGDRDAADVLGTALRELGRALRPWLKDFRAEALVVGGSMTGSWDLLGPALLEGIDIGGPGSPSDLVVSVASRVEHAALLGAASYAQEAGPATGPPRELPGRRRAQGPS